MGTGCRFPPNRAVGIKTQRTGLVDRGHRTAPKNFTRRERKKERQMETERRLSASDPEVVPETNSLRPSCPHGHTIRVTPRVGERLYIRWTIPVFRSSLLSNQSLIIHFNSRESSHSLKPPSSYQSTSISLIEIIQSFEKIEYILSSQILKHSSF